MKTKYTIRTTFLLLMGLLLGANRVGMAQSSIALDVNQLFSSNVFKVGGVVDNGYKTLPTISYNLSFLQEMKNGLIVQGSVGMQTIGSSTFADGNVYTYNFQYAVGKIGVGYELNKFKLKPFVIVAPYYGYLLTGTSASTNASLPFTDLKQNNSILSNDWGFVFNPGVRFEASDYISIFANVSYVYGIENISNLSDRQTYNRGIGFGIGITATIISNKPAKWIQF